VTRRAPPFGSSSPRIACSHGFFSCCSSFDAVSSLSSVAGRLPSLRSERELEALRHGGGVAARGSPSRSGEREDQQACG
jgi:hypothetical protein